MREALSAASARTRALLSGPGRAGRWRQLALLAVMAGIVGAGSPPPPLGLLQPVLGNGTLRQSLFGSPVVTGGLVFLALFLAFMGGVARAFTFGFLEGILAGEPASGSFRKHLRRGAGHYVWSSALTIPLYLVLFAAEALVTHDTYRAFSRLLDNPEGQEGGAVGLLLLWAVKFFLVLVPWTLLTLPLMVFMYELTPARMVLGGAGPGGAAGQVLQLAGRQPRVFWSYLGGRVLLQILGNMAAFMALIPSLLIAALLGLPVMAVAWGAAALAGGPGTGPGTGLLTVGVLLCVVILYCVLCMALLPVSVFLNALALEVAGSGELATETRRHGEGQKSEPGWEHGQ